MQPRQSKKCEACGQEFIRSPKKLGRKQWEATRFCSIKCAWAKFVKHGQADTRLFRVWTGAKNRCFNPNEPQFIHYGGRGIVMADEWAKDFAAFVRDVGPDPGSEFELGRINNDDHYRPGNVRWETRKQNQRNKRSTFWVELDGTKMCLRDVCDQRGAPYKKTWRRLKSGWPLERALSP